MGTYPLPKYHFLVEWGGSQIGFTEVSGLSIEFAVVEYRDGASPVQSVRKMPGLQKFGNIVLKRGVQLDDFDFIKWIKTIQQNTVERRDITIKLLNERHEPAITWKVRNAWPCKYEMSDLHANSNEVLIETLEITHEGIEFMES